MCHFSQARQTQNTRAAPKVGQKGIKLLWPDGRDLSMRTAADERSASLMCIRWYRGAGEKAVFAENGAGSARAADTNCNSSLGGRAQFELHVGVALFCACINYCCRGDNGHQLILPLCTASRNCHDSALFINCCTICEVIALGSAGQVSEKLLQAKIIHGSKRWIIILDTQIASLFCVPLIQTIFLACIYIKILFTVFLYLL